jgi:putative two-component system response regulator
MAERNRALDSDRRIAMTECGAAKILIVDDEPEICEILFRCLSAVGHRCKTVGSAEQAIESLSSDEFHLVLVDLTMPGMSGMDLLTFINSQFQDIAVVMETGVDDVKTALMTFQLGAFGYLTKPFRQNDVVISVASALERRRLLLSNREHEKSLTQKVQTERECLTGMAEEMVLRLLLTAGSRDNETVAHAWRVGLYSALIAKYLLWQDDAVQSLRLAAALHDIGKVGIPEHILFKPGRLTAEENEIMKTHSLIGARILAGSRSPVIRMAQEVAASHHEQWDGSGYPHRLSRTRIPETARIVAVADAYDTLIHNQSWRPALSEDSAVRTMNAYREQTFDPRILDYFISLLPQLRRINEEVKDEEHETRDAGTQGAGSEMTSESPSALRSRACGAIS